MLLEFRHELTGCFVVINDDGRVGYAYLHEPEGEIIGDVWLYNRVPTPDVADWSNPLDAPFPNPSTHSREMDQSLPDGEDDLSVEWTVDGELLLADVYLRGVMFARLTPGSAPGWNVFATQRGPCALPYEED